MIYSLRAYTSKKVNRALLYKLKSIPCHSCILSVNVKTNSSEGRRVLVFRTPRTTRKYNGFLTCHLDLATALIIAHNYYALPAMWPISVNALAYQRACIHPVAFWLPFNSRHIVHNLLLRLLCLKEYRQEPCIFLQGLRDSMGSAFFGFLCWVGLVGGDPWKSLLLCATQLWHALPRNACLTLLLNYWGGWGV